MSQRRLHRQWHRHTPCVASIFTTGKTNNEIPSLCPKKPSNLSFSSLPNRQIHVNLLSPWKIMGSPLKIHKLSSILLKRSWHHPRPSGCPKWWVPSSPWAVAWPAVAIACTATCQDPGRRIPAGLSWNGKYRGWQWKKYKKMGETIRKTWKKHWLDSFVNTSYKLVYGQF